MASIALGVYEKASYRKLIFFILAIALASGVIAYKASGGFASFTGTTNQATTLATGSVTLGFGTTNNLGTGASNIAPGDTIARTVDLSNTGTLNLSAVTFQVSDTNTAPGATALVTDATNGFQVVVQACSVAWTAGSPPTCSGTTTSVLASTSVSSICLGGNGCTGTTPATLSGLTSLTSGNTDHLLVTFTLPTTAPNTDQSLSDNLTYTFTGTQRAAHND